jgi:hypothetical protein
MSMKESFIREPKPMPIQLKAEMLDWTDAYADIWKKMSPVSGTTFKAKT